MKCLHAIKATKPLSLVGHTFLTVKNCKHVFNIGNITCACIIVVGEHYCITWFLVNLSSQSHVKPHTAITFVIPIVDIKLKIKMFLEYG